MISRPPAPPRPATLFPYTTLFRSATRSGDPWRGDAALLPVRRAGRYGKVHPFALWRCLRVTTADAAFACPRAVNPGPARRTVREGRPCASPEIPHFNAFDPSRNRAAQQIRNKEATIGKAACREK